MEGARNGTLDLADFALMNEALVLEAENNWRQMEANKNNG